MQREIGGGPLFRTVELSVYDQKRLSKLEFYLNYSGHKNFRKHEGDIPQIETYLTFEHAVLRKMHGGGKAKTFYRPMDDAEILLMSRKAMSELSFRLGGGFYQCKFNNPIYAWLPDNPAGKAYNAYYMGQVMPLGKIGVAYTFFRTNRYYGYYTKKHTTVLKERQLLFEYLLTPYFDEYLFQYEGNWNRIKERTEINGYQLNRFTGFRLMYKHSRMQLNNHKYRAIIRFSHGISIFPVTSYYEYTVLKLAVSIF